MKIYNNDKQRLPLEEEENYGRMCLLDSVYNFIHLGNTDLYCWRFKILWNTSWGSAARIAIYRTECDDTK